MAKRMTVKPNPSAPELVPVSGHRGDPSLDEPWPEHGLVGDVVFEPPLTPEERRQVGLDVTPEERLALARRQIAEGLDEF